MSKPEDLRENASVRDIAANGVVTVVNTIGPGFGSWPRLMRSFARQLRISSHMTGTRSTTPWEVAKVREFVHEHALEKKLRQRSRRAPSWMLPIIDDILLEETDADG